MWLGEARADISVHLMGPNPGPGHGGISCASPSKSTFSMVWRHNRNAKNAQSQAEKGFYRLHPIALANACLYGIPDHEICYAMDRYVTAGEIRLRRGKWSC